jgi:hypothetical protein
MPIRPIDVVKSQEVSQYKQMQSQKYQHDQVQISKNFQSMIQAEATKTVQTTKSDHREFRYDAKEEGKGSYSGSGRRGKQDKEKQNKENEFENTSDRPGGIDILI